MIAESANAIVKNDWIGVSRQDVSRNCDARRRKQYSFELKRFDVVVEGLVPMFDRFFRAGQLHEVRTLRRLNHSSAQAVDRIGIFWSAVLRHAAGISTLHVDSTNLQPV